MLCLVTAATGSLGSRLVPRLLAAGWRVRCLVAEPARLREVAWADRVEVVLGVEDDLERMRAACTGVDALFLADCAESGRTDGTTRSDVRRRTRDAVMAAHEAGVARVVAHVEGTSTPNGPVELLLGGPVPAAVVRTGPVIAAGTPAFEVVRHLAERVPVMVAPAWMRVPVEPIAMRDLLHWLVAAAESAPEVNRVFDVAGPDAPSCAEMVRGHAATVGLPRRRMVPVRAVVPRSSAFWIAAATPVPRSVALSFIRAVLDERAHRRGGADPGLPPPPGGRTSCDAAMALALTEVDPAEAGAGAAEESSSVLPTDPPWAGRACYVDTRTRRVRGSARSVWRAIDELGRRGRWAPSFVGARVLRDVVDLERIRLWVESRPGETVLRLGVGARVPGRVRMELGVVPHSRGGSLYHQRVVFEPRGLVGLVWWRAISPLRRVLLAALARDVVRDAAQVAAGARAYGAVRPARGT